MAASEKELSRLTTALADRYTIESEIDSGGMATVYRARDLKHGRSVAIKVLRPDLAEAIGADRFLREIRTTANLSHPHILPLFDSGEADGFLFYVMPFVEGESLADRLEREGQLPVEDAVQIAREVADALAYAHDKGVIHRDIKPANILLERGHALLADFGIAQAKAGAEETKLTGSGMSLGTPSYMSPEQIAGNREVDGRSDQYALASVLYEMLAGHAPFTGADIQAVMRQHLAAEPPRVTGARATVPTGVAKALHRALAKTPADRFRTVAEFEKALAGATLPLLARIPVGRARTVVFASTVVLGLGVVAVAVITLVRNPGRPELQDDLVLVLPFENETGDPANDVAGRLVAEAVTTRLERENVARPVPYSAATISWGSARARQAGEPSFDPVAATAREFGAGTVVSGSVFSQRDSLRFEPEIRGSGGSTMVQAFEPVVVANDRIEEGYDTVADRVTAAVAWHSDMGWSGVEGLPPPPTFLAYQAYDRAWRLRQLSRDQEALIEAERALALAPDYPPAKTLLALIHFYLGHLSLADSLLDEVAEVRDQLPSSMSFGWEYQRATLDGHLATNHRLSQEQLDRLSPPPPGMIITAAWDALQVNRLRETLESLSRLEPDSPAMSEGQWVKVVRTRLMALHMLGNHRRELREVQDIRETNPEDANLLIAEIRAQAALGRVQEVAELVQEAISKDVVPQVAARVAAEELSAHEHEAEAPAFYELGLDYLRGRPPETQATIQDRGDVAQFLYFLERWEEADGSLRELLLERPDSLDFLGRWGTLAARSGRPEEARDAANRIAALEIPFDLGASWYWRARIATLLGEKDQAVSLLRRAHQEGLAFSPNLHCDPDLAPLRGYRPFVDFLKPRG